MGLSSGVSANAATWHRGTPSFLRGKYRKHIGSIGWPHKVKNYDWVTIGKNSIVQEAGGGDPAGINHMKYTYVGHHTYKFKGNLMIYGPQTVYAQIKYSGNKIAIKQGYVSHHKIHWYASIRGWHYKY